MQDFKEWLGKTIQEEDIVANKQAKMMQALLNQSTKTLTELPLLYHWLYFLPIVDQAELGTDGHPKKGGFLPQIPFPKRMWAGSRVQFLKPILFEQKIQRHSEISNIVFKQGKSGELFFVTVKHSIYAQGELAIVDEHDIVYREAHNQIQTSKVTPSQQEERHYSYKQSFAADTSLLFRYSALTFNSHKIHYDITYATQVEGYPSLVVHGPLLATLLLHQLAIEYPDKQVAQFEFKAIKPVFQFNDFFICGDIHEQDGSLWIEHSDGQIAIKASVKFRG